MDRLEAIDSRMERLMEINLQSAGNINALSQQLGIISTKVDNLGLEVVNLQDRMQTYEDNLRVSRSQAERIKQAIHQRVCDLLEIRYKNGIVTEECIKADKFYRPGFISKCYSDARRFSSLGTPYYETARRDYCSVLDYINGWAPEVGVSGYKVYLDTRRRLKEEKH